ncbi:gliding motility-associated-like protein [Flavobacterium sp. 81]|uniref:HYR-like domain-containing protein n=1 Tax=Flavobacterium sp. 81 TaxID=2135621 RepID=UPI000EABA1FD|nr:gliding motility-associated C-terminal domain-containing protein [Flavobacterium sp. 81]RKR11964.1 gliding motility-associated-like protein [Flavobacterium sp. 81]
MTDEKGCTDTEQITITEPELALTAAIKTDTNVNCKGDATGSATASATGGTGTYSYSWNTNPIQTSATANNLIAGTYIVTVTDEKGCTDTEQITITEPELALTAAIKTDTNVNCKGDATGSATASATGGTGTYSYSWNTSPVQTSATANNLIAGTYIVTVTDEKGCTDTEQITITEPELALTAAIKTDTNVNCKGDATGSATASATGGTGTYSYSWNTNPIQTSATANNLIAGTYIVTVTDEKGCTDTEQITITEPELALTAAIKTDTNVNCKGDATGSATASATGGTGTYSYSWNTNPVQTSATATNLIAGTYIVTVTDEKGCTDTEQITITEPELALTAAIKTDTNVNCKGDATGSATASATGGTGTYSYSWNTSPIQTSATATNLIAGTYIVTVTDEKGCTDTEQITITEPELALTASKSQVNASCGGAESGSATVVASGGTGPYTYSWNTNPVQTSATATNLLAGNYSVIITDSKGCTHTVTFEILDGDSVKPIIDPLPETSTINCPAEPVFAQATATDDNGTIASLTYEDTVTPGNCAGSYTKTRTWTAKDACGNVSLPVSQTIIVQDITAPTWSTEVASLNKTIECSNAEALSSAQALFPTATDACDTDVSNIVKVSGQFVANEGCANSGTYTNTWTVKDDCGNTSETFTQVITIQDTTAPTWSTEVASLNKTIECSNAEALSSAQALFPTATDACDTDVSNIVKVSGQFVANEGCANSGTYTNTWTVKDDCGNTSDTFTQVITIQDTTAPTWSTEVASLNKTIECSNAEALSSAQALFPTATDACDTDVSNIVKVSGQFVGNEGCANSGTYTNTWTVKDDCGNTSETFTQVITIQDTTAPTWSTEVASLNKTIECSNAEALSSAQALFPTATDACDTDVSNIVKVSGQFVANEGCANSGTYTNTWTVKDDCGNTSDTFTQVITIQDTTAPTWSTEVASLNKTIECSNAEALSSAQALFPTATDTCDTDVSNIVKVSGQFVASETCSNAGTYTNTWTVKDDCGNTSDTFTQVITIQDTTAPIFAGELPGDITVSCDAVPAAANVEASDNCNGNLPIVFSEVKSGIQNECPTNYTLTRKWTTSDCGGNTASYTQIITVRDTTPPTGTAPSNVANLQSIADIPIGSPSDITDAADNCSPTVNITVSDSHNEASGCDGNAYILTRTYTLTDCAGNKTELVRTFTVDNKVSVSAIATNVSCLGANDGSIAVTNSPGSTVIIRNANNEVVGNTNLAPGTYTVTASSAVNAENQTCTATTSVVITEPNYKIKISGQIINIDTNTPLANVPVTLIPQGTTTGPILLRITGADGRYTFTGMPAGSYLVQVQDANLNSAQQLYPVDSSLFFTTLEDCKFQEHNFEYGKSNLPVLGDYVWYDTNGNGVQDEWYDANNDGVVTKNIPDADGAIDFSLWEWIDFNGDGSYAGPQNVGELNAGGFGNAASPNVIVDGPNGYHKEVIVGIEGFWRDRPGTPNPYGDYNIKLVRDANLDAVAAALGATGLVKVIPSGGTNKNKTSKPAKIAMHTVCQTTSTAAYIVTVTAQDLVHLDADFGVNCKELRDIVANDDSAGPFPGVNHTQPNVLNVLPNDTIEGVVVTPSDVIITTVTPNQFLQLNPDGSVDILPNAPAGTLTMVYQICEVDQTSNCDTATVTITIEAPTMTVTATAICVNDVPYLDYVVTPGNFTPVNGVTIAWADPANNVVTTMTDLPLSGRVLWPGAVVDQAGHGIDWPGWVFQNNKWIQAPDGFEGLRPKANVTLSVNPSQTITVDYPPADPFCTARPTFAIIANDDSAGPIPGTIGATNVLNVYTNDTLNGDPVNPADVTLTVVTPDPTGALTLNPDGSVDVKVGTLGGTYTLTYQICENADNGNCDTAIVTVTVVDPAPPTPVDAVDDTYTVGCNTFGLVGNVLANDLKGNIPATLELVNFTLLDQTGNDPNITVDASGNVTVTSLTPAGTYTYSYRICDKLSAENCDTATITITVSPNGVTNISSKACNDDRSPIDLLALLPENTPQTGTWIDTDGSNALQGNVLNAFGLAIGNYKFEYKIADENCPRSVLLNMEVNADCVVLACENIVIHNAFSPNGDGKNDVFVIDNIDETTCYPENTVEIYNRWGILVFETSNYNNTTNNFDGTSRGRTTVKQSDGLPTGTYFYIVTYKSLDGNNVVQNHKLDGYLYLSK